MPNYITKSELAEAKKKIDDRISSLVERMNGIDLRLSNLEKLKSEPEPEVEVTPEVPVSKFAPDIFYGKRISDYKVVQPSSAISEVDAPDGSGDKVFRMRVSDNTVVAGGVRAELIPPGFFGPGDELWWGGAFLLPANMPLPWNNGHFLVSQFFGDPHDGSPPLKIEMLGKEIGWMRNATGNWKILWHKPIQLGKKVTFLKHIKIGKKVGEPALVEVWINGDIVISTNDVAILDNSTRNGTLSPRIQQYRGSGSGLTLDVYHWPMAIGTSRELVDYGATKVS